MNIDHYTYRLTWSSEDGEHLGMCAELPSLSWLAPNQESALTGRQVVADAVADMLANGELVPQPFADKRYSGEFQMRISRKLHRALAVQVAEQGISLNRLANVKLAR